MNVAMAQNLKNSFEALVSKPKISLMQWLKHELSFATTEAVYGPQNPFRDPAVEAAFWYAKPSCRTMVIHIASNATTGRMKITS